MSYTFSDYLLLRRPVNQTHQYTHDPAKILSDQFFLAALHVASPDYYERIARTDFRAEKLSDREIQTLRKYFNRFCFRPTPFGLFASVSLATWGAESRLNGGEYSAYTEPDQAFVQVMAESVPVPPDAARYLPNPTLYRVMNEFRFIFTEIDAANAERTYRLQSITCSEILKSLQRYCRVPKSKDQIASFIGETAVVSPRDAAEYFTFLVDSQLLVDELRPTLIGTGSTGHEGCPTSVTLTRSGDPVVAEHHQEAIRDAIFALDALCPPDQLPAMEQFAAAFQKHFEGQSLPLLSALDPECGIGYFPADTGNQQELLETLQIVPKTTEQKGRKWTAAHSLLLECWHNGDQKIITLEKGKLAGLSARQTTAEINGLSVLFRVAGDQIFLENAGGINPLALMGRFTVTDPAIARAARKIAEAQEALNPDILFAEISHLADPHIDNVNRRENCWSWELPLSAPGRGPRRLALADLSVTVKAGKVVLWSRKHKKMVMPRFSSAYNHHLDKLPLFRFLADLPYQFSRAQLGFELSDFFPGLPFYPRVVYRNSILHLATWEFSSAELPERFTDLPPAFSMTEGDRQLVFFRDNPEDLRFFLACTQSKKTVRVKEFLYARDQVAQFSTCVCGEEPLPVPTWPGSPPQARSQRIFMPGSEWLYLKIYLPRLSTDRLLLRVYRLVRAAYPGGGVRKWFFVRYADPAPHLRVRMLIAPEATGSILAAFKKELSSDIGQQLIREYQVDVYNRELERYAAAGIEPVEDFFWKSSVLAVVYLRVQRSRTVPPAFILAMVSLRDMLDVFLPAKNVQTAFIYRTYGRFLTEFDEGGLKIQLDRKYRQHTAPITEALKDPSFYRSLGLTAAARAFVRSAARLSAITASEGQEAFLDSLIHMHMNRLFPEEGRKQEMTVYYLLYKYLLAEEGRIKQREKS